MASNVKTGGYAIFAGVGSSTTSNGAFNSTMIDNLFVGKVPTSSGTVAYTWRRLFTSADEGATITREGETLDLMTQEEGLKKVVISSPDKYTLEVPVADIIMQNFSELFILNTSYWSSSVSNAMIPVSLSQVGSDMLSYGRPFLIIDKAYQALSTNASMDVPFMPSSSIGTGDPLAMCFIKGGLADRNYTISIGPKSQQILNAKFTFAQVSSTATGGNTFAFSQGLLVASS
jgi:hypothetical protein